MRRDYAIAIFYIFYFFIIYVYFSAVCIWRNEYLYFGRHNVCRMVILESATNLWLLMLSILHNKRIIKQASLSHWVAEYNIKVSSAWDL